MASTPIEYNRASASGQTIASNVQNMVDMKDDFQELYDDLSTNIAAGATNSLTAASTTSGSPTVTCASTGHLVAGITTIAGTGIPGGATVANVVDATHFTLSANATATNTGLTLTATGDDYAAVATALGITGSQTPAQDAYDTLYMLNAWVGDLTAMMARGYKRLSAFAG